MTEGYGEYLKKRHTKHTREVFQKFLESAFKKHDIDIRYPSSMPKVMTEMFWQTDVLRETVVHLFHMIAAVHAYHEEKK